MNVIGIVVIAVVAIIVIGWVLRRLPELRQHVNQIGSLQLGRWWDFCLLVLTPLVLGTTFVLEIITLVRDGYEGYPTVKVAIFGWGLAVLFYGGALLMSRVPWPRGTILDGPPVSD